MTDNAEGTVVMRELIAAVNALLTPENRNNVSLLLASLQKSAASLESASAKLPSTVARADAVARTGETGASRATRSRR